MTKVKIQDIQFTPSKIDPEILQDLKESIRTQGLFHPILVQQVGKIMRNVKLVAGEKRLLAVIELGWEEIPAQFVDEHFTPDQVLETSFHENLKRYNLPWYELVTERKKLHELKQRMHGKSVPGRRHEYAKERAWTAADTARELDISVGQFSEDLLLAGAIQANPSLCKVKDRTTALKLVKQQAKREIAQVEALIPPDFEMDQILLGDSLSILPQFPAYTFDACITDPPWTEYMRNEELTADESTFNVFKEVYRVLKADSFLYLICSSTDFEIYRKLLPTFGYQIQQYPTIWHKTGTITHGRRPWEYARDFELILVAAKGSPVLTSHTEMSSILKFESMHYTRMIHPHEKPIELLEKLLRDCTYEGSKVIDPFSGSGVTLEACKKMGRRFIGIERDGSFYERIVRRLSV